ncbi:MAG: hypothetical protein JJE17_13100, partial [Peptostreptococcaceae bacterium]|nr:hypothetical protein [Peptostreptococcaceae bacterium]
MSNVERDLNFIRLMIYQFYKCRTEYRVSRIVAKYGMEFDDVFQIGCIAYLGAEKSYKDDKGVKFHTFAGHCIKSHLKRIIRDHTLQKRDTTQLSFVSLDDIEIPTEGDFEKVEMK